MANVIRIKQIDQPELSGYILDVTDQNYYPAANPSGYLSSVASDPDFIALSGDLNNTGIILDNKINTLSGFTVSLVNSSGAFLQSEILSLSGDLNATNANLTTVSGLAISAIALTTGLDFDVSGVISGEVSKLNSTITGVSGYLSSQTASVSGIFNSRVTTLENTFAASGSNFLDLASNNQIVSGSKRTLNQLLAIPSDFGGYSSGSTTIASLHKVNKNRVFVTNNTFSGDFPNSLIFFFNFSRNFRNIHNTSIINNNYFFFPAGDDIFCFPVEKNISLQLY